MPQKIRMPSSIRPKSYESGIDVLKNLRSSTLTKMFSATTPTKMAASHSMPLMKRSAKFLRAVFKRTPPGGVPARTARPARWASERRLVLAQGLLERVQHLLRIGAGLLHALGPLAFHGRDGI